MFFFVCDFFFSVELKLICHFQHTDSSYFISPSGSCAILGRKIAIMQHSQTQYELWVAVRQCVCVGMYIYIII